MSQYSARLTLSRLIRMPTAYDLHDERGGGGAGRVCWRVEEPAKAQRAVLCCAGCRHVRRQVGATSSAQRSAARHDTARRNAAWRGTCRAAGGRAPPGCGCRGSWWP